LDEAKQISFFPSSATVCPSKHLIVSAMRRNKCFAKLQITKWTRCWRIELQFYLKKLTAKQKSLITNSGNLLIYRFNSRFSLRTQPTWQWKQT